MFMRWDIINSLIRKFNYKTYLEIGQQKGQTFREIDITTKDGVDPKPKNTLGIDCKYKMTSDQFFKENNRKEKTYDIIFIDGLHIKEQVIKDVNNSLSILNEGGTIILHDCKPETEYQQITSSDALERKDRSLARGENSGGVWTGDVWKAFLYLRINNKNLQMYTVDTDCGCGIITLGKQVLYKPDVSNEEMYTWEYFDKNKKEILNLITVDEFKNFIAEDY
jgi:hypothetical protein